MKNRALIYIAVAMVSSILFTVNIVAAEPVAVIVNANNPVSSLTVAEVKKFYENDVLTWPNGKRVILYDLPTKSASRQQFSTAVMGKSAKEVEMEWSNRKITNTAKNPPFTMISDILIQARVAKGEATIGYMPKNKVKSNKVKIVTIIE